MSNAQRMKEWRAKKLAEDPEFLDKEREKARERANKRYNEFKGDPAYLEAERERKRKVQAKRRANPETNAQIKEQNKRSRAKPENQAKQAERMKLWREANTDRIKEYQEQWRLENAESVAAYRKQYYAHYRTGKYGITLDEFFVLYIEQCGLCKICGTEIGLTSADGNVAHIDHNHDTGKVRGLLCMSCNQGLGLFKDNPVFLDRAIEYLHNEGYYGDD